ncbi:ABC transporter ATP-binding protein [Bacillaceae bacterium SIJ1]|uniref:ABC transporter ATP-binding protein n=1 Tax=Litoribacterium kuwaitense TaxID=1398745 RepID=UPI0013EC7CC1|nr:ABC transporter ATP-binding protein [Litoribacterium kuwaitense]NGP44567.1 ABC transporter ATP-binding protein [Litoribacterium kuwaitense]
MGKNKKSTDVLLDVEQLHTGFSIRGKHYDAVAGVSFQVEPKQVIGVVGESGCGKSVMALSIMNLLPKENGRIQHGDIRFNGESIVSLSESQMNKLRGKDISMIFQEPMTSLNPVFTIGSQLQEVILNHESASKEEAKEKSIALLKDVGIPRPEQIVNSYPHQLSGGMRQRVMIAIAVACNPKLLIADEPTTALDVTVQAQILELMKNIQEENEMAVLMITHDLGVVAEMCDECIVMYAGQIVEYTNVIELFRNPKHPYTELLMKSIPRMDVEQEELATIKGVVPPIDQMPEVGCRFANRCPKVMEDCLTVNPQLAESDPGHDVRCLLYEQSWPVKERVER